MTSTGQDPPRHDPLAPDNDNEISEDELQAYVDGQLPTGERVRIESYLASRPREADRLEAYRKQNIGLHALFDSPQRDDALGDLPPDMAAAARQLDRQMRVSNRGAEQFRNLAAGIALLVAAAGAGWIAFDRLSAPGDPLVAFTRQAAEAHARLASHQVLGTGESGRQVVAWLSQQPEGATLKVPDLESLGFRLVADRVMPAAAGKRAAQLLYQDDDGQRITLYMRAGYASAGHQPVETSFTFRREGQVSQFFWQNGHFAYSLIGMMAQERLLEIAEVISEELQRDVEEAGNTENAAGERIELPGPLILPEPGATVEAGQKAVAEPDEGTTIKATEPGSKTMPAAPELLPLEPLPAPLPEPDSIPKDT